MKQRARMKQSALGPGEGLAAQVWCSYSEAFRQSLSLLSWVVFLGCGFSAGGASQFCFPLKHRLVDKAGRLNKTFFLLIEAQKKHLESFSPSSASSKVWKQHFILFFGLVKVEVFSPPLHRTRSIMLPATLGTVFYILSCFLHPLMCSTPSHDISSHLSLQSTPNSSNASLAFHTRSLLSALPATCCSILHILPVGLCVPQGYLPCHIFHCWRSKPKPNWS